MFIVTGTRIAIFVPNLEGGGAERVMVTLANAFANRGYDVDLILTLRAGEYLRDVADNIRVVDLGTGRVMASLLPLSAYIRRERPAVLLSALSHANVVGLLANLIAGRLTRVTISERSSYYSFRAHNRGLKDRLLRCAMRATYHLADGIIVVSEAVVDELAQAFGLPMDKLHYIPNPVVSDRIPDLAARPAPDPWLAETQVPTILGVGRLSREKGFDVLIRAFARVVANRPAKLIIYGKGPLRETLLKLAIELGIDGQVKLPGFIENPFAAMSSAAVFVLPSRLEGMPGALIQAMACGTPVVSTDCRTGPGDILEGGRWGHLVPVEDDSAMAAAICATLDSKTHPDVRKRAADFDEGSSIMRYLAALGLSS